MGSRRRAAGGLGRGEGRLGDAEGFDGGQPRRGVEGACAGARRALRLRHPVRQLVLDAEPLLEPVAGQLGGLVDLALDPRGRERALDPDLPEALRPRDPHPGGERDVGPQVHQPTAARLHGDLWAGNRLVDDAGRSWLIDPAAHGGHREFDLAMMRLFGGYGPDCFGAYEDDHPLADGWERRVPLHQLAPLVVHAIKFGGGYAGATERALDAVLSA